MKLDYSIFGPYPGYSIGGAELSFLVCSGISSRMMLSASSLLLSEKTCSAMDLATSGFYYSEVVGSLSISVTDSFSLVRVTVGYFYY